MENLRGPKLKEEGALEIMRSIGVRAMGVLLVLGAALSVGGCVESVFDTGKSRDATDYPIVGDMPAQLIDPPYQFVIVDSGEVDVPELPWIPPSPEPYIPVELALDSTEITVL